MSDPTPDAKAPPPRRSRPMPRPRQMLGKYRIVSKLAQGGFATVYRAYDTIEGIGVALKIPNPDLLPRDAIGDFRREVRLSARLDHPNILQIKYAGFVEDYLAIVTPLGERTLADRMKSRISLKRTLDIAEQILSGLACAHRDRIVHCDLKPENVILFPGNRARLADFGIAKIALRTLTGYSAGTLGYIAPEQAMGRPSLRSDVFSMGLMIYQMLSGELPKWPFKWPLPGIERARRRAHPDLLALIRRALEIDEDKRFDDAEKMLNAFLRVKRRALGFRSRRKRKNGGENGRAADWRAVMRRQFLRRFGRALETRLRCEKCEGPISEFMRACPWCGDVPRFDPAQSRFPAHCRRCRRGMKLDWSYCPWCYGAGFEPASRREHTDKRYAARCANPKCARKDLMPFMRYCPWCRTKVRRPWPIPGSKEKCSRCSWGVLREFWDFCPWCDKRLSPPRRGAATPR